MTSPTRWFKGIAHVAALEFELNHQFHIVQPPTASPTANVFVVPSEMLAIRDCDLVTSAGVVGPTPQVVGQIRPSQFRRPLFEGAFFPGRCS